MGDLDRVPRNDVHGMEDEPTEVVDLVYLRAVGACYQQGYLTEEQANALLAEFRTPWTEESAQFFEGVCCAWRLLDDPKFGGQGNPSMEYLHTLLGRRAKRLLR